MSSMGSIKSFHSKHVLQPYIEKYGCKCMKKKAVRETAIAYA